MITSHVAVAGLLYWVGRLGSPPPPEIFWVSVIFSLCGCVHDLLLLHNLIYSAGDIMGQSIENVDGLIRMPYGCGEQNMINFAPNVYVMDYLTAVNQLTDLQEKKALAYMEAGVCLVFGCCCCCVSCFVFVLKKIKMWMVFAHHHHYDCTTLCLQVTKGRSLTRDRMALSVLLETGIPQAACGQFYQLLLLFKKGGGGGEGVV